MTGGWATLRVTIGAMVLLAVACSSASGAEPSGGTTTLSSLTAAIVDDPPEQASGAEALDATDTQTSSESVSVEAARGDAIERVLVSYTEAINDRRAEDAYELFTEGLKERVPLDELVDGTSTSFISRLSVAQVAFDGQQGAAVIASFRTDQAPELGRDGQACSIWELEYRMLDLGDDADAAGDWRIDQANPLGGSPFPCPVVAPEVDERVPAEPPAPGTKTIVHLTLDDGPGPETERFLDLFAEFDVEATFFVNSNRIAGRDAVARRIVSDGHAIANHTHTHCNLQNPNVLTPSALCAARTAADEIEDAQSIIEATTGVTPTCFRPPYGAQSAATKRLVESYGLSSWLWDIDTNDWRFNANNANYSDSQAVAELDKAATIRPSNGSSGVVILLHDGTASAPRMLPLLRSWLEANVGNFEFAALDGCRG